jgi:TetR/AcrR family transcriptional regulator, transcriptional repressor for nem operon
MNTKQSKGRGTAQRARLLHAAEQATYHHGFANTALADIARRARIPLGNVYYYFKTKDQISQAIIHLRLTRFRKLLKEFEKTGGPGERLCAFVQTKITHRIRLARHGCPVGTLCSELHKQNGAVARQSTTLLAEALTWMEAQFRSLGKAEDARGLAIHLLSATQGISVLAQAFRDPKLIDLEAARLQSWIRSFVR